MLYLILSYRIQFSQLFDGYIVSNYHHLNATIRHRPTSDTLVDQTKTVAREMPASSFWNQTEVLLVSSIWALTTEPLVSTLRNI